MKNLAFVLALAACTRSADYAGMECVDFDPARNWPSFCPSPCETYCMELIGGICPEGRVGITHEECLDHCAGLRVDGEVGDETGNTLQCRLFYLTVVRDHFQRGFCGAAHGPEGTNECADAEEP